MNTLIKTMFNDVFGNDLERFQKDVDTFINDMYKDVQVPSFTLSTGSYPKVNIVEREKDFVITAAVPGLKREDLEIAYKDSMLSITGKSQNEKIDASEKFICRELKKSAFNRSFRIDPTKIDINSIKCTLENGELKVSISKKIESSDSEGIKIKID